MSGGFTAGPVRARHQYVRNSIPGPATRRTGTALAGRRRRRKARPQVGRCAGRTPNQKYRDAHVWYDKDEKDSFTAYKLLIADVIGGKLKRCRAAWWPRAGS